MPFIPWTLDLQSATPTPVPVPPTVCQQAGNVLSQLGVGALGPLSVSSDAGSVTQHPLLSLLEIQKYLAAICASRNTRRGLRFNSLIPDGAVHAPPGRGESISVGQW